MSKPLYKGNRNTIHNYLIKQPLFRERKNKNTGIANLIFENHGKKLNEVITLTRDMLDNDIKFILGYDRAWRWLTEHHEDLRGSDYSDKQRLEEEYEMEELDYIPGYHRDLKKLETLA